MPDQLQQYRDELAGLRSHLATQTPEESARDRWLSNALASQSRAAAQPEERWSGPIQLPGGKVVQIRLNSANPEARVVDTNADQQPSYPPGWEPGFLRPGVQREANSAPGFMYTGSPGGEAQARQEYLAGGGPDRARNAQARAVEWLTSRQPQAPVAEPSSPNIQRWDVPNSSQEVIGVNGTYYLRSKGSEGTGTKLGSEEEALNKLLQRLGGGNTNSSTNNTSGGSGEIHKIGNYTWTFGN